MVKCKRKKNIKNIKIISQNIRGIKTDARIQELLNVISKRNALAVCLQETWRNDIELLEHEQYKLILSGLDKSLQTSKRGSQGVAIVLNRDGVNAWNAAGCETHTDLGARIIAVRLLLKDHQKRDVGVFIVSAYAPVGNANESIWNDFLDRLTICISRKHKNDILVIGADTNSSMGHSDEIKNSPVGKFGNPHINESGRRFLSYLSINSLKVTTTTFKKNDYTTWVHPRSKKGHQIDHFITNTEMAHRITDSGITTPLIDSDHRAIFMKIRIMKRLHKKIEPRQKVLCLDHAKLLENDTRERFCQSVSNKLNNLESPNYSNLAKAINDSSLELLPKKSKPQPGWFQANESKLSSLIEARNQALDNCFKKRTRSSSKRLQAARQALKKAVKTAKNQWIDSHCNTLNKHLGTKSAWDALKSLKKGLTVTKPTATRKMRKSDGTYCINAQENASVFRDHFENLYNRHPYFDPSVLDSLEQLPVHTGYDIVPSDEEIIRATSKLKNSAPGESGITSYEWKSLLQSEITFNILRDIIHHIWNTETIPDEWNIGRLTILPKKGDLSLPKNYRGIMLLEVSYKIIAIILQERLRPIQESLDHESQCGFRPDRGCVDAIFTVKTALKKRREHGLESWVFFLDLVKAFDRVPRALLWIILERFGVPIKLINLLKALHVAFKVKFTVDEVTQTMTCSIGVKQGDILGPILFTFFIAAVIITWRNTSEIPPCIFKTKEDAVMTGRRYRAYGEDLALQDSEYADDTALIFSSREETVSGITEIMSLFNRFGMEVHSGPVEPRDESKSVVLFCPKPPSMYENPETYDSIDLSDIVIGQRYIPIVDKFAYLGSMINRDCSDESDVQMRIQKASIAFGSLKKCVFSNSKIKFNVKGKVYSLYIIPILLYGVECWCLTERLLKSLRNFHHRCVRIMCRVNRYQTWVQRISTVELLNKICLKSIDSYICKRQLAWAGHVIRMPWFRLPRKMISCWVRSKRPRGAPRYTYGRSLYKTLKKCNIDTSSWHTIAFDKVRWRNLISNLNI